MDTSSLQGAAGSELPQPVNIDLKTESVSASLRRAIDALQRAEDQAPQVFTLDSARAYVARQLFYSRRTIESIWNAISDHQAALDQDDVFADPVQDDAPLSDLTFSKDITSQEGGA